MRDYAKVSPQFWIGHTGRQIRALGLEAQHIALYLLTCPSATMLGVYYLPLCLMAHETGISHEDVITAFNKLIELGFCSYDETMEYVWVHEMALYQVGEGLKANDNRLKAIQEAYHDLPHLSFLPAFFAKYHEPFLLEERPLMKPLPTPYGGVGKPLRRGFEAPPKPLRSQEQDQEQEKEQEQEGVDGARTVPPPLTIPLADGSDYALQETDIAQWQSMYPMLDVKQTLSQLQAWNIANPRRRKTQGGIQRHILTWLQHEQRHHSRAPPTPSTWNNHLALVDTWITTTENDDDPG